MKNKSAIAVGILVLSLCSCSKRGGPEGTAKGGGLPEGRAFRVFVLADVLTPKMAELRSGLTERLDETLAKAGSTASYEFLMTNLDAAAADSIAERIGSEKPDIVFSLNNPTGFADSRIAAKLKGKEYRFVSENAVPLETGVIQSREKPGGNICGVGVFVQLNSSLRLLRKVMPRVKKIYSYSWDRVGPLNAWWEAELRRACDEEGFEFAEFLLFKSHQAELAYASEFKERRYDSALLVCVSPYVNEDGSLVDPAKAAAVYADYLQNRFDGVFIAYEDSLVRIGALMGACVIWRDLGAQMADLGARVLSGEDPGSIPWEYPRKHNIVINKAKADRLGIKIPSEIMNAAYRVYTDFSGNFMGKAD